MAVFAAAASGVTGEGGAATSDTGAERKRSSRVLIGDATGASIVGRRAVTPSVAPTPLSRPRKRAPAPVVSWRAVWFFLPRFRVLHRLSEFLETFVELLRCEVFLGFLQRVRPAPLGELHGFSGFVAAVVAGAVGARDTGERESCGDDATDDRRGPSRLALGCCHAPPPSGSVCRNTAFGMRIPRARARTDTRVFRACSR
jgi:hypothetical protein